MVFSFKNCDVRKLVQDAKLGELLFPADHLVLILLRAFSDVGVLGRDVRRQCHRGSLLPGKLIVSRYVAESITMIAQDVLATKAFVNCAQN